MLQYDMSPEAVEMRRKMFGRFAKIQLLRRLYVRQMEQTHTLSCSQIHLLEYIRQHAGCRQMDAAQVLGVTPAAVAMMVKRLKQVGYLTATVCAENQRCKQLTITKQGETAMHTNAAAMDAFDAAVFEGFSLQEIRQLADFTNRMGQNMERAMGREPTGIEPQDLQTLVKEMVQAEEAKSQV